MRKNPDFAGRWVRKRFPLPARGGWPPRCYQPPAPRCLCEGPTTVLAPSCPGCGRGGLASGGAPGSSQIRVTYKRVCSFSLHKDLRVTVPEKSAHNTAENLEAALNCITDKGKQAGVSEKSRAQGTLRGECYPACRWETQGRQTSWGGTGSCARDRGGRPVQDASRSPGLRVCLPAAPRVGPLPPPAL